ncbi:MAG: molybdopterin molybdotransferase MoeA [Desulfovibrionaceae bacterium]|nr:molybdopterin molybdotransferase MoeA [Desulfovibrionaceae bacterium]
MGHGFFKVLGRRDFFELLAGFAPLAGEEVELSAALGRVLARDLVAGEDLPLADRSCMDGFAVRAQDLFGAGESNPAYLESVGRIAVDQAPSFTLGPGQCAWIPTGGCLPAGADSVVMVEHTQDLGSGTIELRKSAAPGENVMRRGEDAAAGRVVLAAGRRLRAQEIGLLAGLGLTRPQVHSRPVAGILSTGDEVVPVDSRPLPGQVRDVNSLTVGCLVEQAGGLARPLGIVADDLEALTRALTRALEDCDLVFLSGGSSVGVRDLTLEVLERIPGTEVLAHGVALSPGKPTILARQGDKLFMGLPGQVASAQVVMLVLGQPAVRRLSGDARAFDDGLRSLRRAELARNVASKHGREDYVRVALEPRPGRLPLAHPLLGKSGLLRTLVQCQGLLAVPADLEGLNQGQETDVWLI